MAYLNLGSAVLNTDQKVFKGTDPGQVCTNGDNS